MPLEPVDRSLDAPAVPVARVIDCFQCGDEVFGPAERLICKGCAWVAPSNYTEVR